MIRKGSGNGFVRYIEIENPVLGNNIADAQRLEQALKKELGKEAGSQGVKIPWYLLKTLPTSQPTSLFRLLPN